MAGIGPEASAPLIEQLSSKSARRRALAVAVLGEIAANSPLPPASLAEQVSPLLTDPDRAVRVAAAMTLAELGAPGLATLRQLQSDPELASLAQRLLSGRSN